MLEAPSKLSIVSASAWDSEQLDLLKVQFTDVGYDGFLRLLLSTKQESSTIPIETSAASLLDNIITPERQTLIQNFIAELKPVDRDFKDKFLHMTHRDNPVIIEEFQHPIIKSAGMAFKYHHLESTVDGFVFLFLYRLGFFDEWLYLFPQFEMDLTYGSDVKATSKPDFTVMDVLTFLRVAVVEDKRVQGQDLIDSEPQLIAELISIHQNNTHKKIELKRKKDEVEDVEEPLIGIRVNGLKFFFYFFRMTKSLAEAMRRSQSSVEVTLVSRFAGIADHGLDFCVPEQRELIIFTLAAIKESVQAMGRKSIRRESYSKTNHTPGNNHTEKKS